MKKPKKIFGDDLYRVNISFHLGKLINDALGQHFKNLIAMCKMRGRKMDYVDESKRSFEKFVKDNGKYLDISLIDDKKDIVNDKIMKMEFTCGINKNVKDINHFILCVAMDDIREELKIYNCPMVYFTHIEKDETEHECCHDLIDLLTYRKYFESPLNYIKIEKIQKIS